MSANSSSSFSPHLRSKECLLPETSFIMLSLLVIYTIMSPLFIFVLFVGYQKWRKHHFATLSHIDFFTYNMVLLDLLAVSGTAFYYSGSQNNQEYLLKIGRSMFGIFGPGQMLLHLVTCVERYLAVVHPVIYLRLRGERAIRIRNVTIGCVWLVSFGVLVLIIWFYVDFAFITILLLSLTSVAFCFCSVSVLCALIRPGPGEGRVNGERADQSKQRAFHTMIVITGALSLRLFTNLIISLIQNLSEPYGYLYCVIGWSSVWFFVPSSLVLPLLFLQREGKLPDCGPKSKEPA